LEAICGVVTVAYVFISGVVGVRLLRLSGRAVARSKSRSSVQRRPEFWLGLVFLQQTFHPNERWARGLAWGLAGALLFASILIGVSEGYAVRVRNGAGYWTQFVVRDLVFMWVATDSLRYWLRLRRRMRLGLAEPLLANRFFLMGAWGSTLAVLSWADPIARVWYTLISGSTTEWIPEIGRPILLLNMSVATGLLAVAGSAMLLSFFPTDRYRVWIGQRAEATGATASGC
jgi:hypothetical protein